MRCPQWIRTCVKLFRCEAGWNQAALWNKKSSSRTRSLLLLHQVKYCSEPGCSAQPSSNYCHLKKWKWSSEKKKSWWRAPNLADFNAALYSITPQRVQYMRERGWEELSATEGADLLNRNSPATEINTCGSSSEERKIEGRLMYSLQPVRFSQCAAFADHEGMKKVLYWFIFIHINQKN